MARRRQHAPLRVYLNNRLLGHLLKDAGGAISFRYDPTWLGWENAIPVSLSLPLREDAYRGAPVAAVFENLLPDSETLRRRAPRGPPPVPKPARPPPNPPPAAAPTGAPRRARMPTACLPPSAATASARCNSSAATMMRSTAPAISQATPSTTKLSKSS